MATTAPASRSNGNASPLSGLIQSPLLIGGLTTIAFYAVLPYFPFQTELLEHYFCSHPLSYATTVLFFTAMATLGLKSLSFGGERRALHRIPGEIANIGPSSLEEQCGSIQESLEELPRKMRASSSSNTFSSKIALEEFTEVFHFLLPEPLD